MFEVRRLRLRTNAGKERVAAAVDYESDIGSFEWRFELG